MRNVETITVENDLCTSCGICKAVCPKKCIRFIRVNGQYVPQISEKDCCVNCGICLDICPGYEVDLCKLYDFANQKQPKDFYIGNYKDCFIANAKHKVIRSIGTSGGCITTIVKELLNTEKCDAAFLVDSYEYNNFLQSNLYRKGNPLNNTTKSRYVPISHSRMIKYVLENRNDKLIFVGTSCAVQGFLKVIEKFKLDRDNYLILGLFCDKTMSYNVFEYFSDYRKTKSKLKNLLFRTKENGGWPGQVKLEYENGEIKFLPAKERMILKDYFQLERCMYCIDKLNQFADISFGDNYIGKYISKEGTNSVIVRTSRGIRMWKLMENVIDVIPSSIEDIYRSQHIDERSLNCEFAKLKNKQSNIDIYLNNDLKAKGSMSKIDASIIMKNKLELINLGRNYEKKKLYFHRRINRIKIRGYTIRVINGIKNKIKRILKETK